jgi:hypothetical protein
MKIMLDHLEFLKENSKKFVRNERVKKYEKKYFKAWIQYVRCRKVHEKKMKKWVSEIAKLAEEYKSAQMKTVVLRKMLKIRLGMVYSVARCKQKMKKLKKSREFYKKLYLVMIHTCSEGKNAEKVELKTVNLHFRDLMLLYKQTLEFMFLRQRVKYSLAMKLQ